MKRWRTISETARRRPAISGIVLILVLLGIAGAWIGLPTSHPPTGTREDPVLVAGDFNALPFSKEIKRFNLLGLTFAQDSTRVRRVGTWSPAPWIPKAARIDYILLPSQMNPIDTWVVGLPGSDHRALIADVEVEL